MTACSYRTRRARRRAAAFLALAAALAGLALAAGPASAASDADRDADKVFDDLERLLASRGADSRVDVIVALRGPASHDRVGKLERAHEFAASRRLALVDGFSARLTQEHVRALAGSAAVANVQWDAPIRAQNNSAQDSFGVRKARLDSGLDGDGDGTPSTYSAGDLVAAVIDTGIDAAHQDLDGGKVLAFADCVGHPCAPAAAVDPNGHGTHVAATIAGDGSARLDLRYRGVAPASGLVGVRVLDASGNGSMSSAIAGLQWVVANRATYGIEVVNMSLGADGCHGGTDASSVAVNNAVAAGLVVVVSAGNEGPGSCTVGSPGAAASAVTVGAMSDLGEGGFRLASFSSRGPTADGRVKPDIVGPGVGITSAATGTGTGYASSSGTSMASPFVGGVALLMLEANPTLAPAAVKARLMATAVDWGLPGPDAEYGSGRLDAYAAIAAAGAPIASPPAVPAHIVRDVTVPSAGTADLPVVVVDTGFPVAVTLTAPAWSSVFGPFVSLSLVSPGGSTVATGSQTGRHAELAHTPTGTGTYTLRITSTNPGTRLGVDLSGAFAPVPVATVQPSISGAAAVGATLTASPGTWSSATPLSFAYAWRMCDAAGVSCTDVAGATQGSFVVPETAIGSTFRVAVTATGVAGSTTAVTAPTAVVATPPDTEAPIVRAVASSGRRGASVRLVYRVADASGRARERVRVLRGSRALRTLSTRLSAREAGRAYYVFWRAPRRAERLRFCVQAWDGGGNASRVSCAPLRIR